MNPRTLSPIALAIFLGSLGPVLAQESATEETESAARSLLSDPRLQNMLRSVKNDPEGTVESLKTNPDDAVRDATRIFHENKDKIDTSSIDTPENRAKAESLTTAAMTKASELQGGGNEGKVPATRSATGATRFITPVAMPTEESAKPIAADSAPNTIVQQKAIQPLANSEPTVPQIPDTPALSADDIPAPQPLSPKYPAKPAGSSRPPGNNHMEIKARESEMDNKTGVITFRGNVFVDHPDFDIKCENLEIQMGEGMGSGENSSGKFERAIASGGMVEIRRIGEEGELQVALARRADYNGITKDIILSGGPPSIQAGEKLVETNSPDSQIIMRGNGKYEVKGSGQGSGNRVHMVFPVDSDGGTQDIGLGQGLGDGVKKLR